MERNKIIYLINTSVFLIASFILFFLGISSDVWGLFFGLVLACLIIHLLIFLFLIFRADFSRKKNLTSSIFNWITLLFLSHWFYLFVYVQPTMKNLPEGGGFGLGFYFIFFLWPAIGISNLISWISSIVFYFKNRIVLSEKDKTNIKRFGKIKWTLIFGIILSAILIPSYVIYETYFHYWTNKVTSEINYYGYNFSSLVFIFIFSFLLGFIITLLLNNIKDIIYIRKNNFT